MSLVWLIPPYTSTVTSTEVPERAVPGSIHIAPASVPYRLRQTSTLSGGEVEHCAAHRRIQIQILPHYLFRRTEQYADHAARAASLEGTHKALLALLERAKDVPDVLKVQRELSSVVQQLCVRCCCGKPFPYCSSPLLILSSPLLSSPLLSLSSPLLSSPLLILSSPLLSSTRSRTLTHTCTLAERAGRHRQRASSLELISRRFGSSSTKGHLRRTTTTLTPAPTGLLLSGVRRQLSTVVSSSSRTRWSSPRMPQSSLRC